MSVSISSIRTAVDFMEREFAGVDRLKMIDHTTIPEVAKRSIPLYCLGNREEISLTQSKHVIFWAQGRVLKNNLSHEDTRSLISLTTSFKTACDSYKREVEALKNDEEYKELRSKIVPMFGKKISEEDKAAIVSKALAAKYEKVGMAFMELDALRAQLVEKLSKIQKKSLEIDEKQDSMGLVGEDEDPTEESEPENRVAKKDSTKNNEWLSKLFSDIKTDIEEDISGAKTLVKKRDLIDSLEELIKQPSKVITWYLYKTIHMGDEPEKKIFAQGIVDHLGGHGTVFGSSFKRSSSKRAQESVEDVVATHGPFNTNKGSKHGVLKTGRAKKLLADLTAFITTKIAEIRKSI